MIYQDGWNKPYYNAIRAYARKRNYRSFREAFLDIAQQMEPRRASITPFYNYLHGTSVPDLVDALQFGRIVGRRVEAVWPVTGGRKET